MDSFPTEILVKIFSLLKPSDLLSAEKACNHWFMVIDEYIWNELTVIDEATIGFPDDDFLNNLTQLARRVRKVNTFVNIYALLTDSMCENSTILPALKEAIVRLIVKRAPNAVFPLDLIKDVITVEYIRQKTKLNQPIQLEDVHLAMSVALNEFDLNSFCAIRIKDFFHHDFKPEANSFVVWCNEKELSLPLPYSKVTRLCIECLIFKLDWFGWFTPGPFNRAVMQLERIRSMTNLELVEIEALQFWIPHQLAGEEPYLAIKLHFHRPYQLTGVEFKSLLHEMANIEDGHRMSNVMSKLADWKSSNSIRNVHLQLHSDDFKSLRYIFGLFTNYERVDDDFLLNSCSTKLLIYHILSLFIDKLHLTLSDEVSDREIEHFLALLIDEHILERLKQLSLSFQYDWNDDGERRPLNSRLGAYHVKVILRIIADQLKNVESLTFNFLAGGRRCLPSLFRPLALVAEPLPRLTEFVYRGLPCFPFLISVITNAANLRHLTVQSQPFYDDRAGLNWILKLVESLADCSGLVSLSVRVIHEDNLPGCRSGRRPPREEAILLRPSEYQETLAKIDSSAKQLLSVSSRLLCLSMTLECYNYQLAVDKRCPQHATAVSH